ncbi:putative disease resistance protein RF45 [Salvia divinorum]|uniref:Disease resistance protein RF45 n=1 Tax=Salvia divinorum TaxID=28513 RepID=A0ABD1GU94_SALDI
MAEYLVNVFLETLRDLLVEEAKFLLGVDDDVVTINGDLESIHALLMKADRERHDSPTLNSCIRQLKKLAEKAENLLDTYAFEVESKREEGRRSLKDKFQRYICIICECYSVHKVGKEARRIISGMAKLTSELKSEMDQQGSSLWKQEYEVQRQSRQTYAHDVEPHFVAMEEDIEILVSKMKDENRQRVVKIYGMGGLGKTTPCQKEQKSVFGKILKLLDSSTVEEVQGLEVDELVDRIQRTPVGRKCVIVVDDIWEDDHWEIIRKAFPVNCNVILTTRYENNANQQSEPHKLKFLTKDEVESSIEDIGRQIVSKCEGLPLSICVIGGILRQKEHTLIEWRRVNESMESYLRHGEGFSEDEEIDTERLYLLWMAEGFISYQDKGPNETLRNVAQRYLIELAMRCMVQLHEAEIYSPRDKFDWCKLHDLMHDLCSLEANSEKFMRCTNASKHLNVIPSTGRRLALHQSIDNSSRVSKLPKSIWSLPYLQTLDLRVEMLFRSISLPNVIWKMKRLKHLFLPLFGIQVIGGGELRLDGLHELETLERIDSKTACIADIPKLANLQSLEVSVNDVDSMSIVFSNKNGQLRDTQLRVDECDLSSEKGREILNGGLMSSSLVTLWFWKCNMSDCFPYYKQGMCQNLVDLELSSCKGKVDVMKFGEYPMLQSLSVEEVEMTETLICHSNSFPQLKELNLEYLDDLKKWEVKDRAMPKLVSLKINKCSNLEEVPDGLRFISTLRKMEIESMPREFMERVKEEDYAPSVKIERSIWDSNSSQD